MTETPARHLLILGSTGSIGRQALEVLPAVPAVRLVGLAAGRSAGQLLQQAAAHGVREVCLHDAHAAAEAAARAPQLQVHAGEAGVHELISHAAEGAAAEGAELMVLNGIVGAAGLRATMATIEAGATLALANKESMVAGGPFVLEAARISGSPILPVDSEHSAIFQCLQTQTTCPGATRHVAVEELLLTGSGGPFRGRKPVELASVTPEQALAHPNWAMGPKISVDSATLMNKGLELIEAHYLFDVPYEHITVVLDPRSTVHSMARFSDGAILAHLGVPDMRTPIGYALGYPHRPFLPQVRRLDVFATQIAFERPDTTTFRCLELAEEAGKKAAIVECEAAAGSRAEGSQRARPSRAGEAATGGAAAACRPRTVAAPIVLNAANEVAVEAFLGGRLAFLGIADVVEKCLTWLGDEPVENLDDVFECDAEARRFAREAAAAPA